MNYFLVILCVEFRQVSLDSVLKQLIVRMFSFIVLCIKQSIDTWLPSNLTCPLYRGNLYKIWLLSMKSCSFFNILSCQCKRQELEFLVTIKYCPFNHFGLQVWVKIKLDSFSCYLIKLYLGFLWVQEIQVTILLVCHITWVGVWFFVVKGSKEKLCLEGYT